jgi:hypothetical protein
MNKMAILLSSVMGLGAIGMPVAQAAEARSSVVRAHATDQWSFTLKAGVSYDIVIDGDGDTDLDVYLYDENGALIDVDDDPTDFAIVSVTPRWTGRFVLKIVNHGRVYNRYVLTIE